MKKFLKITAWTLTVIAALIALFYAEENWRGARAWRKTAAELRAKGYPLTISDIIPPPVADDENIAAAPVFAEVFTADGDDNKSARLVATKLLHTKQEMLSDFLTGRLGDLRYYYEPQPKFTQTEREAAEKILAEMDQEWTPLLAEVHAALQRPRCRWPLAYEKGFAIPVTNLTAGLNLAKTLQLRASCYLAAGRPEQAADDVLLICQLARTAETASNLIGMLVSVTEQKFAAQVVWEGCARHLWRERDLARLQTAIPAGKNFALAQTAFQNEQAVFSTELSRLSKITPYNHLLQSIGLSKLDWLCICLRPRGWVDLEKVKYAELMDVFVSCADFVGVNKCEAWDEQMEVAANFLHRIRFPWLGLLPGYSGVYKRIAQTEASNNQAVLACALERYRLRHGKLPLTLGELTPEFIEKIPNQVTVSDTMIYRRVSDSDYVLYSIGWNLQDDGGTISDDNTCGRKFDWVWASKPEHYQRKH